MSKAKAKGIFCLEGDWWNDLKHDTSVHPILTMLSQLDPYPRYIHRIVDTRDNFNHYLEKWVQKRYSDYPILYLAFHGDPRTLYVGDQRKSDNKVSLDEIAEKLAGRCSKRIIHFGACETLDCDGRYLTRFLRETGCLAVCGFKTEVDWVQSAAIEVIILSALQTRSRTVHGMRAVRKDIKDMAGSLIKTLGFRMFIKTPRKRR